MLSMGIRWWYHFPWQNQYHVITYSPGQSSNLLKLCVLHKSLSCLDHEGTIKSIWNVSPITPLTSTRIYVGHKALIDWKTVLENMLLHDTNSTKENDTTTLCPLTTYSVLYVITTVTSTPSGDDPPSKLSPNHDMLKGFVYGRYEIISICTTR